MKSDNFYEKFWEDSTYQQKYAFDVAVRDRLPAILKVWGDLIRPKRVLDLGSGNGVLTYWLKLNGFGECVNGFDISKTGVDNANRSFKRDGLEFFTLEKLKEISPGSFDVVVSSHVLEHIENPAASLECILDKAEWFILEVPLESCLWQEFLFRLRPKARTNNDLGHVNFWSRNSFREFLTNAGLIIIKDYQYASAPFSPYNHSLKKIVERIMFALFGVSLYGKIMTTHYVVLARKTDLLRK